jgi:hypothetical protein
MRARVNDAQELIHVLKVYEMASGQVINRDKSSIMFSPNTKQHDRSLICSILSIGVEAKSERYLGLPISVGKSKKRTFEYIKKKIWNIIQGWQEKLLSKAGKEILIKAVAQSIPTYVMSCFDLTKGVCDELSMIIARYWWSQQDKTNKIHWLSWEKLTRSKKKGGLGFRDLHLFNLAMLSRQAWRLLINPDTLCGQVLKAKYFPNSDILHCVPRVGISYTWRSILKGVELLKEGLIWRIGNGEKVKIWEDPWLPKGSTRKPITPRRSCLLTRVDELIDPSTGGWDEQLILDNFWLEDATEILRIPVDVHTEDWPAWYFDAKGLFSVKSAYKVAVARRDAVTCHDASTSGTAGGGEGDCKWHKIWHLKVPNKVQMFIWRLAHNSLPVRKNVANRGIELDTKCPVCRRMDEDCGHLFFKCKFAKLCWRLMNMEFIRIELMKCRSGVDTIGKIWELEETIQLKVIIFLWRWWSARNKANDAGRMKNANEIYSSVCYFLMEFEKLERNVMREKGEPKSKWKSPPEDTYKINSDGSFDPNNRSEGWGFVVRNKNGDILAAGAGNITYVASALQAEAIAVYQKFRVSCKQHG